MAAPEYPWPEWFTPAEMRDEAEVFLREFWPAGSVPVNIERIVDAAAGLDVVTAPGIFRAYGIDGFLSDDMKSIYVDDALSNGTTLHRFRFTLAHEVAHWYLHAPLYEAAAYRSAEEFLAFRRRLSAKDLAAYEWQANQFAGLILAPPKALAQKVEEAIAVAYDRGFDAIDLTDPMHRDFLAEWVGRRLEVSAQVVIRRGTDDSLW